MCVYEIYSIQLFRMIASDIASEASNSAGGSIQHVHISVHSSHISPQAGQHKAASRASHRNKRLRIQSAAGRGNKHTRNISCRHASLSESPTPMSGSGMDLGSLPFPAPLANRLEPPPLLFFNISASAQIDKWHF